MYFLYGVLSLTFYMDRTLYFLCMHIDKTEMGRRWGIRCTDFTRGDRRGDILPNSSYENPRRSLTFQYSTMARTKEQEAIKLAHVAHCMENWVRAENKLLYEKIEELKQKHEEELISNADYALKLIQRRERRIRELEAQWEDMANTLHDAVEENFRLIKRIEIIEAQLLDCTCNEESV